MGDHYETVHRHLLKVAVRDCGDRGSGSAGDQRGGGMGQVMLFDCLFDGNTEPQTKERSDVLAIVGFDRRRSVGLMNVGGVHFFLRVIGFG